MFLNYIRRCAGSRIRINKNNEPNKIICGLKSDNIDNIDALEFNVCKIHDNGYVHLIDCCPRITPSGILPESAIARAARVSTSMGLRELKEDESLILRLARSGHTSPFENLSFVFNIRTTIEVMRQFVRHRTFRLNEFSLRYKEIPKENNSKNENNNECHIVGKKIEFSRRINIKNAIRLQGEKSNKQGSAKNNVYEMMDEIGLEFNKIGMDIRNTEEIKEIEYYILNNIDIIDYNNLIIDEKINDLKFMTLRYGGAIGNGFYHNLLNKLKIYYKIINNIKYSENLASEQFRIYHELCDLGASREISRSYLPVATYTEIQVSCDMNNLLKFFFLRCDRKSAQHEIADLADAMMNLITPLVPTVIKFYKEKTNMFPKN